MGGTDFLRFGSRASGCVCSHSVLKANAGASTPQQCADEGCWWEAGGGNAPSKAAARPISAIAATVLAEQEQKKKKGGWTKKLFGL